MKEKPLKKFTSIDEITFQDIFEILEQWEKEMIDDEDVLNFAEGIYYLDESKWPDYPNSDQNSVLFATLQLLAALHIEPILKSDIPALRNFLTMGQLFPLKAWQFIDSYWDSIDKDKRLEESY